MSNRLADLYWEEHGFAGLSIEAFLDDVAAGRYGPVTPEEIRTFLFEMEAAILENIENKASEAPQLAAMVPALIQDTRERFRRLRERYAR